MYDITQTQDEITKQEILAINNVASSVINYMKGGEQQAYETFWFNSKVTPQEFCDGLGPLASKMFQDHYDTGVFILSKDPSYIPLKIPEGWTYVVNSDYTVTLTYTPPVIIPTE